jgi:hypothetical protein
MMSNLLWISADTRKVDTQEPSSDSTVFTTQLAQGMGGGAGLGAWVRAGAAWRECRPAVGSQQGAARGAARRAKARAGWGDSALGLANPM